MREGGRARLSTQLQRFRRVLASTPELPGCPSFARRVRLQHERITLTRNGEAEAVLPSVDDLDGLEMTAWIRRRCGP